MSLNPDNRRLLIEEAKKATSSQSRGQLVRDWVAVTGLSRATILRIIAEGGVAPTRKSAGGRKTRHNLSNDQFLNVIGQIHTSRRKTGQKITGVARAIEIAELRGIVKPGELTVAQARHQMKKEGLLVRDILAPSPTAEHRADHPNEVQFFDASVCLQWHFNTPKQQMEWLSWSMDLEKNKIVETISRQQKADRRRIWRMAMTDRYSGLIYFKYYLTEGESTIFVAQFLEDAWFRKSNPAIPFCGMPKLLIADQGPGNASAPIKNLCKSYGIAYALHSTGRSTAKGQVESAHNIIQHSFESLLCATVPVWDIDELNRRAEDWQARFNSTAILRRNNRNVATRNELWGHITEDQLRVPDDHQAFRLAASYGERELPVSGRGIVRTKIQHAGETIDFKVPTEFKSTWGREKIKVIVNPFEWRDHKAILVSIDGKYYMRAPFVAVDRAGQHVDATHYLSPRRTATNKQEKFRQSAESTELLPAAWPEMIPSEERRIAATVALPPAHIARPTTIVERTWTAIEAKMQVFDALPGLQKYLRAEISARITGPMTTAEIDNLISEYKPYLSRIAGSAAG